MKVSPNNKMLLIQTITKATVTVTETTQETHKTTCERERRKRELEKKTTPCNVQYGIDNMQ